jgi:hypothetical protein
MIYQILFWVGVFGVASQAIMGGARRGARNSRGTRNAKGARGAKSVRGTKSVRGGMRGRVTETLLGLLSPLTIFSICLGAGVVGLLLPHAVSSLLRALCAIAGGIAFNVLLVQPMIALVMRFVSDPAENLKSAVHQEAEVISRFDATGRGIVCLSIDGQKSRVLATLHNNEDPTTVTVGERLVVTEIDPKRNTCRVMRL